MASTCVKPHISSNVRALMGRADFAQVEEVDNALLPIDELEPTAVKKAFAEFEFEEVEMDSYMPEDLQLDEYAF
jgi:hypothetical protein